MVRKLPITVTVLVEKAAATSFFQLILMPALLQSNPTPMYGMQVMNVEVWWQDMSYCYLRFSLW